MKNIDGIFINNIIHNFERRGVPVESNNKMLVIGFILINRGIIPGGRNCKTDVCFLYVVGKSRLIGRPGYPARIINFLSNEDTPWLCRGVHH
jgi:hypothetical protein